MSWIANARMYAVTPTVAGTWSELFAWIAERSGVPLEVLTHAPALPIADLWTRPDLACAFMCGRPWLRATPPPVPIACPIPSPPRYGGRPRYMTDMVVRADSPFRTIEDTFGKRVGYTLEESQSGFNAPRHHLLAYRSAGRTTLYNRSVGPLHTPRGVVRALMEGAIDVGPLDSYAFDLMRTDPDDAALSLRVVATTAPAPIPFLVASPGCPAEVVEALRAAFLDVAAAAELRDVRQRLLIRGFAAVELGAYTLLSAWEQDALTAGYPLPA